MSDYAIPVPEPREVDETVAMELRALPPNAGLGGRPSWWEASTDAG